MTAPTEAEIRAALTKFEPDHFEIGPWVHELAAPINYVQPEDRGPSYSGRVWDDLRASEEARLHELIDGIYVVGDALAAELVERITDAVVAAALTFAQEHPDAPRAVREPVTA